MPVEGINGILNVESAALHAPQVGVANTNPQHILSVGSNLYVSGDSPDVLTVDGNVVCEGVKVGLIEIIPSYDLEAVSNVGNTTSNTIQFTNPDTGIVATGNVSVGKTLTVEGNVTVGQSLVVNNNVYASNLPLAQVASNLITWDSTTGDLMDSGGLISNKLAIVSEQPPAALTGDSMVIDGHGKYVVASSTGTAYNAFDKSSTTWTSDSTYNENTGAYDGLVDLGGAQTEGGEYITIEFPYKTTLRHVTILPGGTTASFPGTAYIYGTNDNGTTWTSLKNWSGVIPSSTLAVQTFTVNASGSYKKYALVVNATSSGSTTAQVGELRLFTETFAVDSGKSILAGPINVNSNMDVSGKLKTSEIEEVTPSINTPFNIDTNIIGTWLNADNPGNIVVDGSAKVTQVWDETSLGNNFTVSADRGVTYDTSKRMLYFDGREASTNHMEAPLPTSVTTNDEPYCFTVVVEIDGPPAVEPSIQLIANLFNSDNDGTDRRHNLYLSGNGTRVNSHASQNSDTLINRDRVRTKYIATINFDGTTASLYVNGLFASETTQVVSARPEAVLRIGSDSDNSNDYSFKSWLGEAIFFTRNLTEDELIHLHKYLNAKWDIYKKPVFDIFTAAGQSNMSGRAGDATATVQPDYGREFDPQYWTAATKTPLKLIRDPVGATDTIDTSSTGSCLPAFCEEYYKQTGRECIILYCAKGGSSIFNSGQWDIDYKDTNYVKRSTDILKKAEITLNSWGYEVKNKSLLWHQGESDEAQTAAAYKAKFLELYDYWISNGYDNVFYYEISRTAANDFANPRAAQREMWKDRANLHFVFSCYKFFEQSKFSDSIHYSPEGYDEMGREGAKYAAKVLNATRNATVEKVLDIVPGGTSSTSGIKIPYGTTAQRPTNARVGTIRYNTNFNEIEYFKGTSWFSLGVLDGSIESKAAQSASALRAVLGSTATDGLYYLQMPGMSQPEQFYIYFDKEFASEGIHNYIVLSTFGSGGGGIFTTSNWTNTGTIANVDPRTATTAYSRLYLLDTIFQKIDGKYYTWLQNQLEVSDNPWIEWVTAQTANPYASKSGSVDVAGKELIFRTPGISDWGEFGGYHNQSVDYSTAGGKISGSINLGNWYWNAALTVYWGDNIPVSAGSVTYTYNDTDYDISGQSGESIHNIFAVAN